MFKAGGKKAGVLTVEREVLLSKRTQSNRPTVNLIIS